MFFWMQGTWLKTYTSVPRQLDVLITENKI